MEILRLGFAGLGEAATMVLPDVVEIPFVKVTAAADLRKDALERFARAQGRGDRALRSGGEGKEDVS